VKVYHFSDHTILVTINYISGIRSKHAHYSIFAETVINVRNKSPVIQKPVFLQEVTWYDSSARSAVWCMISGLMHIPMFISLMVPMWFFCLFVNCFNFHIFCQPLRELRLPCYIAYLPVLHLCCMFHFSDDERNDDDDDGVRKKNLFLPHRRQAECLHARARWAFASARRYVFFRCSIATSASPQQHLTIIRQPLPWPAL